MRKFMAAAAAALVMLASAASFAGVVITETESMVSGTAPRTSERTIMIEGNKEKMVTDSNLVITDLDKGMMYIVDPAQKTYTEMEFPPRGQMARMIGGPAFHAMSFSKSGKARTVAGFKCEEYSGSGKFMMGDFAVVSCISDKAPGAADFNKFEKAMVSKLKGTSLAMPANMPDGIPLTQDTTTKMTTTNLANLPPEAAAQLKERFANKPPIVTKTEVTKVTAQKIAANEFEVPSGYTKREAMMGGMGAHSGMGGSGSSGTPPPSSGGNE